MVWSLGWLLMRWERNFCLIAMSSLDMRSDSSNLHLRLNPGIFTLHYCFMLTVTSDLIGRSKLLGWLLWFIQMMPPMISSKSFLYRFFNRRVDFRLIQHSWAMLWHPSTLLDWFLDSISMKAGHTPARADPCYILPRKWITFFLYLPDLSLGPVKRQFARWWLQGFSNQSHYHFPGVWCKLFFIILFSYVQILGALVFTLSPWRQDHTLRHRGIFIELI